MLKNQSTNNLPKITILLVFNDPHDQVAANTRIRSTNPLQEILVTT